MFEFLNPFRDIIKTDASPHARTLRTSFTKKLKDAFNIFAGYWERSAGASLFPRHIGIEDKGMEFVYEKNQLAGLKFKGNNNFYLPIFKENASAEEKQLARAILKLNFAEVTSKFENLNKDNSDKKVDSRRVLSLLRSAP